MSIKTKLFLSLAAIFLVFLFPFYPELSVIGLSGMIGFFISPVISLLPVIIYDLLYMPINSKLPYMTLSWIVVIFLYYTFGTLRKRLVRW